LQAHGVQILQYILKSTISTINNVPTPKSLNCHCITDGIIKSLFQHSLIDHSKFTCIQCARNYNILYCKLKYKPCPIIFPKVRQLDGMLRCLGSVMEVWSNSVSRHMGLLRVVNIATYGLIIRNVNFKFLSYRAAWNYTHCNTTMHSRYEELRAIIFSRHMGLLRVVNIATHGLMSTSSFWATEQHEITPTVTLLCTVDMKNWELLFFVASTTDYKLSYYSETDRLICQACTSLLVFFNKTLSFCLYQVYFSIR
jgi:hypothetical protein